MQDLETKGNDMNTNSRHFSVGDQVIPRPGGAVELQRADQRKTPGTVIEASDLRHAANGYRVSVRWSDDDSETGLMDSNLFDRA